ncbi:efflux RND transporter permease subunit [Coralloluteibacterium thermophilus]|uniref:Efflux RND transporter permease subunit n=1 Tax=Coralloluteibacterium thermophilum TaxID=2707049 RepID=A0ABV9NIA5_9GAMM
MHAMIAAAFSRVRTVLLLLCLILLAGAYAYVTIPKEASPEIDIPIFIVSVAYPGISAEDSARLLVEPIERRLQSLQGLRRMTAQAGEGFATLTLEFDPGFDQQAAFQNVRDETDNAVPDLPAGAERPFVREVDVSLFPILTVALSGQVPERELIRVARELGDRLETLPGVLEASLSGDREDLLEVVIDPLAMQSYGIAAQDIVQAVRNNNQLVAAGAFDTGSGRIPVSIPGTIQSLADVMEIPVLVSETGVVRVRDVAEVRQTFHDRESFARIDGQATIGIDISKTAGANVIDTVAGVQALVEAARRDWPDAVRIDYLQNQAEDIQSLLGDLENNVIAAVLLVTATMVLALGLRAALLVAVAIPGAFLGGILAIHLLGFTLNIVVLFGLILVIGMLVDGAIVVVELAERLRSEGRERREAFLQAARRMAWPITASTATTLAVFVPLLFWPGVAGQFMRFLPATVIVTLSASLLMALVFVPVIGVLFPGRGRGRADAARPQPAPQGDEARAGAVPPRVAGAYARALDRAIARPGATFALSVGLLFGSFVLYGLIGRGFDFFPFVEPERAQVQVQANGNLSIHEADRIVRLVEQRILGTEGVERVYARTMGSVEGRLGANVAPDVIGTIQVDFTDWRSREPAAAILDRIRAATATLPGIGVQIEAQESGPGAARPVQIEVSSPDRARLAVAAQRLQAMMAGQDGLVDVASDAPVPRVEIRIDVDREQAARHGVDMTTLGTTVQLLTNGVLLGTYLPDFASDEVEIRLRYPASERTFAQLADLRVATPNGSVPIGNFVRLAPGPAPAVVNRVDARNVQTVSAGLAQGRNVNVEIERLRARLAEAPLGDDVEIAFAGEIEDQQEAGTFLVLAFVLALFLMFLVLLTQLDSFFQSLLVLSAIGFSIAGVLFGLILRQESFSIVMSGIGIMALAGIVVNNNIVLIDAYNEHRGNGLAPADAARRAGSERLRPVMLTAITTIVGLLPMVLGMTIDFFGRDLYFGAPSGQFWVQLSTAIAGGLAFATLVTALLTPALLAWDGERRLRRAARRARAA